MSYGHAERNLATVRVLCAETIRLLAKRQVLTPDEKQWLDEVTTQPDPHGYRVGRADDAGRAQAGGQPAAEAAGDRPAANGMP